MNTRDKNPQKTGARIALVLGFAGLALFSVGCSGGEDTSKQGSIGIWDGIDSVANTDQYGAGRGKAGAASAGVISVRSGERVLSAAELRANEFVSADRYQRERAAAELRANEFVSAAESLRREAARRESLPFGDRTACQALPAQEQKLIEMQWSAQTSDTAAANLAGFRASVETLRRQCSGFQ